jgi:hypothetical protein
MPDDTNPRSSQHLSFLEYIPATTRPVRKLVDSQTQPLTIGTPFHLKMAFLGLSAIVRKSQESELLRLLASSPGILAGEATKFDTLSLFLGQLQTKVYQSGS